MKGGFLLEECGWHRGDGDWGLHICVTQDTAHMRGLHSLRKSSGRIKASPDTLPSLQVILSCVPPR